jgi:hypothetical protein
LRSNSFYRKEKVVGSNGKKTIKNGSIFADTLKISYQMHNFKSTQCYLETKPPLPDHHA